jgi:hypothetical protein
MSGAVFVAYSRPAADEREREFNRWYDDVHIPQILRRVPGIAAAERYRLSPAQLPDPGGKSPRTYLTIYRLDGDSDAGEVLQRLETALRNGTLELSDALDVSCYPPVLYVWEPT